MDNNILQTLSNLFGKKEMPNNTSCTMQGVPLYPSEAYTQSQDGQQEQNGQNQTNNFLPLLLSLLNQNGGDLSSVLSNSNNSDIAALAKFFNTLNKKKKDKEKENDNVNDDKKEEVIKTSSQGQILKNQYFN